MKWFQIAQTLVQVVGPMIPGFAPFAPLVSGGIGEAQMLHGNRSDEEKRQHVFNIVAIAAQGAQQTGHVSLDPATAVQVTKAIFTAIDGVHDVVKANKDLTPTPSPTV